MDKMLKILDDCCRRINEHPALWPQEGQTVCVEPGSELDALFAVRDGVMRVRESLEEKMKNAILKRQLGYGADYHINLRQGTAGNQPFR